MYWGSQVLSFSIGSNRERLTSKTHSLNKLVEAVVPAPQSIGFGDQSPSAGNETRAMSVAYETALSNCNTAFSMVKVEPEPLHETSFSAFSSSKNYPPTTVHLPHPASACDLSHPEYFEDAHSWLTSETLEQHAMDYMKTL
ncbi:hypothetical protein DSO57_1037747 [Entomophthora muscae]|uniref:Uncharacterized protein n=1 Tax=Entomophthora muscae TaxID=34485 RepID=A0ACC2TWR7_9FUNG|nr:hypothetical protein DSO57_1037747 [Entomophthora muscae]